MGGGAEGFSLSDFIQERRLELDLNVFQDPISRYTLLYIRDTPEISVTELSEILTGWINENSEQVATFEDRDLIELQLYHVYLPKLAELGLVEFDADSGVIRRRELSDFAEDVLELCVEHEQGKRE